MNAAVRPAEPADVDAVLTLWRVAEAAASATDDPEGVLALIDHDPGALLVATAGDEVVGVLVAAFDGWRGNMYRLAVHPDHRRAGVATALVAEGEARLARRGCRRITALVLAAEDHATGFWRSAGYAHQEEIDRYVKTLGPA